MFFWLSFQNAMVFVTGDKYYGTKATINAWKPQIQEQAEFSWSQLEIRGGDAHTAINTIQAGWMVYLLFNFIFTFFFLGPCKTLNY